jgi:hypothetical protein
MTSLHAATVGLDVGGLTKVWANTNPLTQGILRIRLSERDAALFVRVWGSGDPEPADWGEVQVETLHADRPASSRTIAFTATYDLGSMECRMQGNVNQGLLVIACFTVFRDARGRSNYFAREFFHEVSE